MNKKIITIVGARPQFVKAAALSPQLREKFTEVLVHTGQHYDYEMSQANFKALNIPKPNYNLNVGSGSHTQQTAKIMAGLEDIVSKEKPTAVLVYGDTNSTLAGALVAAKLDIPVIHIEAGARSFDRTMPEEVNRVATDHLSSVLFAATKVAVKNLANEGIKKQVYYVGNIMDDILFTSLPKAKKIVDSLLKKYDLNSKKYILATIHRPANTDSPMVLKNIFNALGGLSEAVVMPLHPRTKSALKKYKIQPSANIKIIPPVNYIESIALQSQALKIITDSGGMQNEAFLLSRPCYTLRTTTEWPETVLSGWNILVDPNSKKLLKILSGALEQRSVHRNNPHAAKKIVQQLTKIYL